MSILTCRTAGESHGPALTAFMDGLPAGLPLDFVFIKEELHRRQGGYGRGARQRIEHDVAYFMSGVRNGETTGGPVVIQIMNRDSRLDDPVKTPPVHRPRPGHADFAGAMKWLTTDCRNTLERASARETAARSAIGAVSWHLLRGFGIRGFGFVRSVLDAVTDVEPEEKNLEALLTTRNESEVYCPDALVTESMIANIRKAKQDKDTLGGIIEVHVFGCPPGLGSCGQWDSKLDGRLAGAVMSIQAMKSVEIGLGHQVAKFSGSQVHDPIQYDASQVDRPNLGFVRPSNNAGGIEGGMSNGNPIVIRAAMKPIATLLQGMPSVDLRTKQSEHSAYERSDVCAIAAASVVMEHVVGYEIARAFLGKFGGDTMEEVRAGYESYLELARSLSSEVASETAEAVEDDTET